MRKSTITKVLISMLLSAIIVAVPLSAKNVKGTGQGVGTIDSSNYVKGNVFIAIGRENKQYAPAKGLKLTPAMLDTSVSKETYILTLDKKNRVVKVKNDKGVVLMDVPKERGVKAKK